MTKYIPYIIDFFILKEQFFVPHEHRNRLFAIIYK